MSEPYVHISRLVDSEDRPQVLAELKVILASVSPEIEGFLQNQKRSIISELEAESGKQVIINADPNCAGANYNMSCYNNRGSILRF